MKKMYVLPFVLILLGLWSCQSIDDNGNCPTSETSDKEANVKISIISDAKTRSTVEGTPDEKYVSTLDVFLFDSNGMFVCLRGAFVLNGQLQVTLPVGDNYTAYFIANSRSIIRDLVPDDDAAEQYVGNTDWNYFQAKLIDSDPARLLQTNDVYTSLPMWGTLAGQNVEPNIVNEWPVLSLIRSVASVDVYVAETANTFTLEDATLYFVPNKGYIGNLVDNIVNNVPQAAKAPTDMTTTLTLVSNEYDADTRSIASKLYLYDNDAEDNSETKSHTRLIIGGTYNSKKYYYPIDFENAQADKLITLIRNNKYKINIKTVSGPGYSDKDEASTQPPVNINVEIVEWNMTEGQMGVSGNYYLWTEKKSVTLFREANTTANSGLNSNILTSAIDISFKTEKNGTATAITNGIQNDRFKVEFTSDENGYPTNLKFTALGEYDADNAESNSDVLVIISGRIRLEIQINRYNVGENDWDFDDDIIVDIE